MRLVEASQPGLLEVCVDLFGSVNKETLFNRLEGLVARTASRSADDQLGLQAPVGRDIPLAGDLVVDQGVVVLQVGTQAFLLQSGPHCKEMLVSCGCQSGRAVTYQLSDAWRWCAHSIEGTSRHTGERSPAASRRPWGLRRRE